MKLVVNVFRRMIETPVLQARSQEGGALVKT